MKIYVASSWRNYKQQFVVNDLRNAGHEVYDFKNPNENGGGGFSWLEIDPNYEKWNPVQYVKALEHPRAIEGFNADFEAMQWADACLMVQPCGVSAALELGWSVGAGKHTAIYLEATNNPELMVKMTDNLFYCINGILNWLKELEKTNDG